MQRKTVFRCSNVAHGINAAHFYRGVLEKILAGDYRCFRVDSEGMHAWEHTIYYQGRDLDRVMREFTTAEISRLFASTDGIKWEIVGNWCQASATWGSSMEHAYGREGAGE